MGIPVVVRLQFVAIVLLANIAVPLAARADVFNMPLGDTSMQFITVGDPGNLADATTGGTSGAVGYTFNMGKYDVTMAQYAQFLNAVALGQITPGPVVQTVAVVGYAAAGLLGGLLAPLVAFTPSFIFVLLGAQHFDRLRSNAVARAFLDGAGPAAIGAILGSAISLARALTQPWQYAVLAAAAIVLLLLRRGVVSTLLVAAAAGVILVSAGLALPQ